MKIVFLHQQFTVFKYFYVYYIFTVFLYIVRTSLIITNLINMGQRWAQLILNI